MNYTEIQLARRQRRIEILRLWESGEFTKSELAERFGVKTHRLRQIIIAFQKTPEEIQAIKVRRSECQRVRYQKNPEKFRKLVRDAYAADLEKNRQKRRVARVADVVVAREKDRVRRAKRKIEINEQARQRRKTNPRYLEVSRAWSRKNADARKAASLRWKHRNRQYLNQRDRELSANLSENIIAKTLKIPVSVLRRHPELLEAKRNQIKILRKLKNKQNAQEPQQPATSPR
jgi:hypothetical protein